MLDDDKAKAEKLLKQRELAAKGLAPRKDGKPIDPMGDIGIPDIDNDPDTPLSQEEKQKRVANGAIIGLGLRR